MVHTRACRPAPRPAEVEPTAPGVRLSAVGQDRNLHLLDPHDKAAATRRRGAGASGRCVQTTTHFIIINYIHTTIIVVHNGHDNDNALGEKSSRVLSGASVVSLGQPGIPILT